MTPAATDPLASLVQYGVLGLILIMLLSGMLWPKPAVDELKRLHAAENEEHAKEKELWTRDILPALNTNARLLRTNTNEMADLSELMRNRSQ